MAGGINTAATYDGNTTRFYIDGAFMGSKQMLLNTSDGKLVIGRSRDEGNYLKGAIDEVRVYDRLLSAQEINELHLTERPSFDIGLVAYYPFNGNANDESGNDHNGTVQGATLSTDRHGVNSRAYDFDGTDDQITVGPTRQL